MIRTLLLLLLLVPSVPAAPLPLKWWPGGTHGPLTTEERRTWERYVGQLDVWDRGMALYAWSSLCRTDAERRALVRRAVELLAAAER